MIFRQLLAGTLVFVGGVAAQQHWFVSCAGAPGSHFQDLPAAVAAASAGDTIWLIRDCTGFPAASYTGAVIDKPLTIVGLDGLATLPGGVTRAVIKGPITIRNILAGGRVILSNLNLRYDPSVMANPAHGSSSRTAREMCCWKMSHV